MDELPQQPTCWTKCLKDLLENNQLEKLGISSHHLLKKRDKRFRYTIVHALMAGDIEEETVRQCFNVLRKQSLISLITAKDKEGDTPMHSAIITGTKPELIKLLMNAVSGMKTKRRLLLERNKHGDDPISSAFNLQRWPIVEVLLEECIKCRVLSNLTGISDDVDCSKSKTLLHKAMQRGYIAYLEIYLKVCRKCTNSISLRALLVRDKRGYTPWYYFLNLDEEKIEAGLKLLKEHGVDVNKLHCNPTGHTSLLHEAYRMEKHRVCDLLVEYGAKLDREDAHHLLPQQRRRVFSRPTTTVHHDASTQRRPRRPLNIAVDRESPLVEEVVEEGPGNENNGVDSADHVVGDEDAFVAECVPQVNPECREVPPSPAHARVQLVDALNLEVPNPRRLYPRQECCYVPSLTHCCVPPPPRSLIPIWESQGARLHVPFGWRVLPHGRCFRQVAMAEGGRQHLLLRWTPQASSYFAQVDQSQVGEPDFCAVYVKNYQYITSFNTMFPM